jgi:hypothetical protein
MPPIRPQLDSAALDDFVRWLAELLAEDLAATDSTPPVEPASKKETKDGQAGIDRQAVLETDRIGSSYRPLNGSGLP